MSTLWVFSTALRYIVNVHNFISSSYYSHQLSLSSHRTSSLDHEDRSNLCHHRRRRLSRFDNYSRLFVHSANSSIDRHYYIQVSHLFIYRSTSSFSRLVNSRRCSSSALIHITQRLLRHVSCDFVQWSRRQSRNSFDHQHDVAFLWSSSELLSRSTESVTVQLSTNSFLRRNYVFCTRHVAPIRRCSQRFYVFLTRASEYIFDHHKLYDRFSRHVTYTRWQSISSLDVLIIHSLRFIRKLSYEFFLRTHQALTFLSECVLWRHLSSKSFINQVCLYVVAEIFDFTFVMQLFVTLYQNNVLREDLSRALIIRVDDEFKISLTIHDKLKVEAEQYINLWIPSISFSFFLQSHSFVVASCEEDEWTTLKLLIDPQKEFTFKLQRSARYGSESDSNDSRLALFTNSHGISASLNDFEWLLMIASKFEIVTQLSYLRQLIRDYNDFTICTRRIRLVWQLENIDECADRQWWLSSSRWQRTRHQRKTFWIKLWRKMHWMTATYVIAVLMARLMFTEISQILRIFIYYAFKHIEHDFLNEDQHRRVSAYKRFVNLNDVLKAEVLKEYKSDKSNEMPSSTIMKKREENWDTETLVDEEPEPGKSKLASESKILSLPKNRKKSDEMLVMSESSNSINRHDLLTNIEVSESQEIRDDLRRLVRDYLNDELSLLKMNYQSNKWYVRVRLSR